MNLVKILTEDEIQAIQEYRKNASSPMELRISAMIMLGLTVGLRKSDVASLRFGDVSFNDRTISIVQTKTKKRLLLPLPVEAANSLYRYIKEGRPVSRVSDFIFITHRAPYKNISSSSCNEAIKIALNNLNYSFHILRKTFATKLLAHGNNIDNIASALGHSSNSSLDPYLSVDVEHMRMCPLNLDLFPYTGNLDL